MKKILYVIGSPRSGSTLIYRSLCSNNETNPPLPETHLVDQIIKTYAYQVNRFIIEEDYIFDDEKDLTNYLNICLEKFFDKIQKKYRTNILVLKSIVCSPNAHILHHIFPNISFVLCVRDPRDMIASMINVGIQQEEKNIKNQFPRDMKKLCKRINDSYRILFTLDLPKKFFDSISVVKYEDFIKKPTDILNKISKNLSLKLEYKKNFSIWERGNYIIEDDHLGYESKLWNKPISKKSAGSYKNFLDSKEIIEINNLCSKLISRFNYEY